MNGGMGGGHFLGKEVEPQRRGPLARAAELFNRLRGRGRQDQPSPNEPSVQGPAVAVSLEDFRAKFRAAVSRLNKKSTEEDRPTNNPRVVIAKVIDPSNNTVIGHSLEVISSNKLNTRTFVTLSIPLDENPEETEEAAAQRRLLTGILVADALGDIVSYAWVMKPDVPYNPQNPPASLIPLGDRTRIKGELAEVQPYAVQGVPSTQPPSSA